MSCHLNCSIIYTELVSAVSVYSPEVSCLYQNLTCFCGYLAKLIISVHVAVLFIVLMQVQRFIHTRSLCTGLTHTCTCSTYIYGGTVYIGAMLTVVPYSHVDSDAKVVFLGTSHLGMLGLLRTCSFTGCWYASESVVPSVQVCLAPGLTVKAWLWL